MSLKEREWKNRLPVTWSRVGRLGEYHACGACSLEFRSYLKAKAEWDALHEAAFGSKALNDYSIKEWAEIMDAFYEKHPRVEPRDYIEDFDALLVPPPADWCIDD